MRIEDLLKLRYGQPLYTIVRSKEEPRVRAQSASFVSVSLVRTSLSSQSAWIQRSDQSTMTVVPAEHLYLTKEEADKIVTSNGG